MNGIIGFIILIILFNILNRILRAAAGRQQAPPAPRPDLPAESPAAETEAAEGEAPRSLESWIEEIFEGSAESGRTARPAGVESAAPETTAEHMRRYTDFERHAESEIERTERLARERLLAAAAPPPPPELSAAGPRGGAPPAHGADPVFAVLRGGVSLRNAFVAAEILAPCRARIVQRSRMPRAARSVLG
ncbi:MAG: hypothetical protein C4574_02170 [Candidatus Latescibacterota bacterium]|jgi:hypothetical protein|nr:MAG: hypothetical protein C4574_02170 [Candidatus Latescibacterota bacterium]